MTSLGKVVTGVTTTIKSGALSAPKENAIRAKRDNQEADAKEKNVTEARYMYKRLGEPTFNCITAGGKRINFLGGRFFAALDDKDVNDCLAHFVKKGKIIREEQEPTDSEQVPAPEAPEEE